MTQVLYVNCYSAGTGGDGECWSCLVKLSFMNEREVVLSGLNEAEGALERRGEKDVGVPVIWHRIV